MVLTSGIDIIHVYMNRSWFAAVWWNTPCTCSKFT